MPTIRELQLFLKLEEQAEPAGIIPEGATHSFKAGVFIGLLNRRRGLLVSGIYAKKIDAPDQRFKNSTVFRALNETPLLGRNGDRDAELGKGIIFLANIQDARELTPENFETSKT